MEWIGEGASLLIVVDGRVGGDPRHQEGSESGPCQRDHID